MDLCYAVTSFHVPSATPLGRLELMRLEDKASLVHLVCFTGSFEDHCRRLKALNILQAPIVLLTPDLARASSVTLTPKRKGFFQRTTWYARRGPTAEDELYPSIEEAVAYSFKLGFCILVNPKVLIKQYMPDEV
jgi:hypothetical protein